MTKLKENRIGRTSTLLLIKQDLFDHIVFDGYCTRVNNAGNSMSHRTAPMS